VRGVRVIEPRRELRLADEPLVRGPGHLAGEDLDHRIAIEADLARAIDLAEAAGADAFDDLELAEPTAHDVQALGRAPHRAILSPAGGSLALCKLHFA
jgi:hypothetical protein